LADPVVELAVEVGAALPGADLLALEDLEVVREAGDDEHVGQAGAEHVVGLGGHGPRSVRWNTLGFWTELAEKKAALLLSLRGMRAMKPCSANSYSLRSSIAASQGFLVLSSPPCSYWWRGRL
jgi:hypothetical protein